MKFLHLIKRKSVQFYSVLIQTLRRHAWLLGLLLLNLGLAACLSHLKDSGFSSRKYPLFIGFSYGLFGLLAIWYSIGCAAVWIRWPVAMFIGYGLLLNIQTIGGYDQNEANGQDLLYGTCWIVSLGVGEIVRQFVGPFRREYLNTVRPIRQFSILYLLGWTTAIAAVVAFAMSRWDTYVKILSIYNYTGMAMSGVATSIVTAYLLIARYPFIHAIFSIVFSWLLGMLVLFLIHDAARLQDITYVWHFGMIYLSQCLMMMVTLSVVRLVGYRPHWKFDHELN